MRKWGKITFIDISLFNFYFDAFSIRFHAFQTFLCPLYEKTSFVYQICFYENAAPSLKHIFSIVVSLKDAFSKYIYDF